MPISCTNNNIEWKLLNRFCFVHNLYAPRFVSQCFPTQKIITLKPPSKRYRTYTVHIIISSCTQPTQLLTPLDKVLVKWQRVEVETLNQKVKSFLLFLLKLVKNWPCTCIWFVSFGSVHAITGICSWQNIWEYNTHGGNRVTPRLHLTFAEQ